MLEMFFRQNINFPHVSDHFQCFLKFDLFDLCDPWRPIKGQNNACLSVNFIFYGQELTFQHDITPKID